MAVRSVPHNPFTSQEIAAAYDGWFETPLGAAVDRLQRALIYRLAEPRPGERALDVGSGTGHYALELARMGLQVTGLDSSEAMLAVARSKSSRVIWQRGEADALPFEDGRFDLVLCVTAWEFMPQRERALAEMYRVVVPGGRLVIGVLNAKSAWGRHYIRQAQQQETPFRYAHFFQAEEFVAALSTYGPVRWNSAVFFGPDGRGLRLAGLLEWLGQRLFRDRGSLLVGRVDK